MLGRGACIVLAAMLAVPLPGAADWLQELGDGEGTNRSSVVGPSWNDVVFDLAFDRNTCFQEEARIVVVDRTLFTTHGVCTNSFLRPNPEQGTVLSVVLDVSLIALDLDSGVVRTLYNFTVHHGQEIPLASDGQVLFVATGEKLLKLSLNGQVLATADLASPIPANFGQLEKTGYCSRMSVHGDRLAVTCHDSEAFGSMAFLAVFGAVDLKPVGAAWVIPSLLIPTSTDPLTAFGQIVNAPTPNQQPTVVGLTFTGDLAILSLDYVPIVRLYPTTADASYCLQDHTERMLVYDIDSGQLVWHKDFFYNCQYNPGEPFNVFSPGLVHDGRLYWRDSYLVTCTLPDCQDQSTSPHLRESLVEGDRGTGMALVGEDLVVPFKARTYRLAVDNQVLWRSDLPEGARWGATALVTDGTTVFGAYSTGPFNQNVPENYVLQALDVDSGQLLWDRQLGAQGNAPILGLDEGVLAVRSENGLLVLGLSGASPAVHALASTLYPASGSVVDVDLTGSEAGSGGPVVEYMAEWGDGERTSWQTSPRLQHAFADSTDREARFYARNEAGQTASLATTFHVGQPDPAVNILNSPFSDEYQNTSFFILGLLGTAAVALFGIARAGRKRRRFHRELRGLEDDHARLHDDTRACDAMLATRKSAARALFLQKKLEEAHASFLERRIDELRKGLRLGTIEDKLAFLPHGMVVSLQRLLADARVDQWERNHFIDALAKEKDLSAAQRNTARKVIDDWFARDAGPKA